MNWCYAVTDAALRARVLAADVSPENPVSGVATRAVTVRPDRLAVDAVIDMLDAGADHLVVVDPLRGVLGVLSAADLMGVETRSPFALRHAILRATDEDELVAAAQNLRRLFLALLDAGLASVDIGRVLSLQFDTFTVRLLDLAIEAHGAAPVPWAWLALGSAARREFTLGSDHEDALAYAASHGVPVDQSPRDIFSRDGNLWHLSHEGGNLEDPWDAPQKEMFKLTVDPEDAPDEPEVVTLGLERGVPVTLNGERLGPVEMVETLNRIAGAHGVGRLDLVENRLVGIKSRGVYETPAGTVLHVAHREIERLVLDRNTLHFKQSVSVRYAQLIYDGLWFSTLRQALAAFVDYTEKEVTGEVKVRLFKGRAEAVGRRSPRSLYRQDLATFGEGMAYDHQDAEGFIRLFGLPERVRALTRDAEGADGKQKTAERARKPAEKAGTRG